jgi:MFS family permease
MADETRSPLVSVVVTPHAMYLLATSLVGRLPSGMAALALVQLVRLEHGSFSLAGTVTALYVVAGAVGQPALGRLIDRIGQTLVLVLAAVLGSAAFVDIGLSIRDLPVAAMVCAVVAGVFTPPLDPSLRSLWPRIVSNERVLAAAFSLDAGAQELVFIAGPLLTVVGIAAFGPIGDIVFAAALGLVGTLAFALDRVSRQARPDAAAAATPHRSPMRGTRFRRLIVLQFGIGLPVGALTIAATAFGERGGLSWFAGVALAANAVGALIGATVSAARPSAREPRPLIPMFGLLLGVGYLPLAIPGLPFPLWLLFALIAGIMLPPTLGQVFSWVQKTSEPRSLTEANAWAISAINVGIAVGTTVAGLIAGFESLMILIAVIACWLLCLPALVAFRTADLHELPVQTR